MVQGYRMVGIPDGLGAFASSPRQFTLIMNNELLATNGIARAHGSKGAFVSRWVIDRRTLEVERGEDFTPSPQKVFLPQESAFFHQGKGTRERIYMNGEEVAQGRAWARIATGPHKGEAWQLPRFGHMSYENAVACPHPQDKTVVMLTDDSNLSTAGTPAAFPSEVYVYVGTKTKHGHPIEQAGLTNGRLYGLKITVNGQPVAEESNEFGLGSATGGFVGSGRFSLFNLGDVSNLDGLALEQASVTNDITRLQRPEDGAWDPRKGRRDNFYFVTTASLTNNCRLWHLNFDDIERPERGAPSRCY
jgi:hypothetical protein